MSTKVGIVGSGIVGQTSPTAEAHFVKAFSCIANAFMVNPDFNGVKPTMFICGNHDGAKIEVTIILDQFGFDVADMGTVDGARAAALHSLVHSGIPE